MTSSRTFAARNTAVRHNHSTKFCLESTKWQIYFKIGTKKLKINAFKCWKWQHKWYNYMIRSYSFQNSRAFPMACATFETTAQKTLGTLACSAIYNSFSWNASLTMSTVTSWPLFSRGFKSSRSLPVECLLLTMIQTGVKVQLMACVLLHNVFCNCCDRGTMTLWTLVKETVDCWALHFSRDSHIGFLTKLCRILVKIASYQNVEKFKL